MQAARNQPDFQVTSDLMHATADQLLLCQNIPAIAGGNQILQELQQMRQETHQMHQDIDNQFQALNDRMLAGQQNALARTYNSVVTRPDMPLSPLVALDGTDIPTFPATVADLRILNREEINVILQALGLYTAQAPIGQKRDALEKISGCLTQHR